MAIKLEMLRVFRTVAEHGTLNGAATALGRTPSALSMMLTQLEDHISAPLFETARKNRLTPLGQLVLEESSRATDAFSRSLDAIGRHAMSVAGTVRIATVPSATVTLLPDVIAAFRKLRPERWCFARLDQALVRPDNWGPGRLFSQNWPVMRRFLGAPASGIVSQKTCSKKAASPPTCALGTRPGVGRFRPANPQRTS